MEDDKVKQGEVTEIDKLYTKLKLFEIAVNFVGEEGFIKDVEEIYNMGLKYLDLDK